MDENQLLATLMEAVPCSDCPVAHASGGHPNCQFETSSVSAGSVVYSEADPADRVWFVKSGVVTISRDGEDTAAVALREGMFGVDCLVSSRRLRSAEAATDAQLCSISKEALLAWLDGEAARLRLVIDAALEDPDVPAILDTM